MTNQVKRNFLTGAGYTKALNEAEYDYLNAQLSSTGRPVPLPQRWGQYLDQEGVLSGAFNKRIREYFLSLGIAEGNINKMWREYWTTYAGTGGGTADEYWNNVQLLLNGDQGTDGDNNTTFTGATITGSPDAAHVNPYNPHVIDIAKGDRIIVNESASEFELGTGDFTIEFWLQPRQVSGDQRLLNWRDTNSGSFGSPGITQNASGPSSVINFGVAGTGTILTTTATFDIGEWYHVAWVRESGVLSVYVDGVLDGSVSYTGSLTSQLNKINIGSNDDSTRRSNCQLKDIRLVKGTAVYTTAFTPPTEALTAISGTSLLIGATNYLVDGSSFGNTFTATGAAVVPGGPYNAAYDSNAGSIVYPNDTSGNTNYIYYPSAQTGMGTNFTIEFWYYPYTTSTSYAAFNAGTILESDIAAGATTEDWWHFYQNTDDIGFASAASGSAADVGTWANVLRDNQWHHLLMTYNGTNLELFVNGVSQGTVAWASGSSGTGTRNLYVGKQPTLSQYARGLICDVRLSDTVRETADFTPPTAPLTSDANTTELLQFNEAACGDLTGRSIVTETGDAQMDTAISKYGTGSLLFDGTGDYLQATVEAPGTGDFTIECWARFDAITGEGLFQMDATLGGAIQGPAAGYNNGGNEWTIYYGTSQLVGTNAPVAGTWYHVAYVRSSGVTKLYIDGAEEISVADTTNYTDTNIFIGGWYNTSFLLDGNIDDFRYTKGVARYTSAFTPPESAFGTR